MPDQIEFKGLADANRDMERWARQLGPAVTERAQPFAERVADQVRNDVPVLTGTLAAGVDVVEVDEDGLHGVGVGHDPDVPYAGWIEFGGSRGRSLMPEGRYLYPAAVTAEADFATIAEDIAEDTARSFPWSTPTS
jgi:hypothetical protein